MRKVINLTCDSPTSIVLLVHHLPRSAYTHPAAPQLAASLRTSQTRLRLHVPAHHLKLVVVVLALRGKLRLCCWILLLALLRCELAHSHRLELCRSPRPS
jgi:hypothetical protein